MNLHRRTRSYLSRLVNGRALAWGYDLAAAIGTVAFVGAFWLLLSALAK